MEIDNICSKYNGKSAIVIGILALMLMYITAPLVNITYAQNNQSSSSSSSSSASNATATSDKSGTIASVQNGPDAKPAWKVSGTWNLKNLNSNSPTFNADFSMMKLDGSAMHKHSITDFKIGGSQIKTNTSSSTYNGTATISMKEGPVSNVPISINLSNNGDMNIMVDPKATNNHFGNTAIQGKTT